MRGGYKIIDFQNTKLSTTSETATIIKGIYEEIEGNYNKATLCTNVIIDSVEYDEFFTNFVSSESSYTGILMTDMSSSEAGTTQTYLTISVNDDDEVTVSEIEVNTTED